MSVQIYRSGHLQPGLQRYSIKGPQLVFIGDLKVNITQIWFTERYRVVLPYITGSRLKCFREFIIFLLSLGFWRGGEGGKRIKAFQVMMLYYYLLLINVIYLWEELYHIHTGLFIWTCLNPCNLLLDAENHLNTASLYFHFYPDIYYATQFSSWLQ